MSTKYLLLSAILAVGVGVSWRGLAKNTASAQSAAVVPTPVEGKLPTLSGATTWLNSPPLTAAGLRGKVVLFDFWTYSCINWRRTLPYVRAWATKYKANGLVVVAVHSPEFAFERNLDNIRWAARDMRIDFPIAVDSDHLIWAAFANQYWPALYFVDAEGNIAHHQFGEGEYERAERVIQQLLGEAGARNVAHDLVALDARGAEQAPDWLDLRSPENYLGYERSQNFASLPGAVADESHGYAFPARLSLNSWALAGDWTVRADAIALDKAHGRIAYRFHARDLHLVMGPSKRGSAVRFRVLIDGQPPAASHGTDVDAQGSGTVIEQRMYQVLRQTAPIIDRRFEIEFLDPGVEGFSFTFG